MSRFKDSCPAHWTTPESEHGAGIEPTPPIAIAVRAVGIEPTSNGLRIRCLSSRPDAHGALFETRARSFLIDVTIRFSKTTTSVDVVAAVGRPGIEPGQLEERLIYSQARVHSGITTRIESGRRELNPSLRHGEPACHHNTSTAGHTSPVEPPSGIEPEPAPYKSAALCRNELRGRQ
jgi:hypothetical protein